MILACSLQTAIEWTTLLANIATCITAGGIIAAIFSFFKNKVSKKTFRVQFEFYHAEFWEDAISLLCSISFQNFTDRELSVISVNLCIDGSIFEIKEENLLSNTISVIKDLPFSPYYSLTIKNANIVIPYNLKFKKSFLKVKTTVGEFVYGIDTRKIRRSVEDFEEQLRRNSQKTI